MMNFIKITMTCVFILLPLSSWTNLYCQDQSVSTDCVESSKWIRLTEVKGEWVIYHYCYAGIGTLKITKPSDGPMKLIIFYGQDSDMYEVLEIIRDNDRCRLRVKNSYSQSGETKELSFCFLDDSYRLTEWDLGGSSGKVRYILSGFENDVPALYENNGDCGEP